MLDCFLSQIGKYDRAIKAFEAILADLLDRYGDDHHRVGAALHNVAVANLRAGKLNDARDAIEEAVRIRENTLGKKHPKVAVRLAVFVFSLCSLSFRISNSLFLLGFDG